MSNIFTKFHDLRHTFASQFVSNSDDIRALAGILGHASTVMTERYAHFSPEYAQRSANIVSFEASSTRAVDQPEVILPYTIRPSLAQVA